MSGDGNLFLNISGDAAGEEVTTLLAAPNVRIERTVSTGQASPQGFWYDQDWSEWVIVLAGSAGLLVEGEAGPRNLKPGDYVHLPAHKRHRIEWTDRARPTIWLAVHHT